MKPSVYWVSLPGEMDPVHYVDVLFSVTIDVADIHARNLNMFAGQNG